MNIMLENTRRIERREKENGNVLVYVPIPHNEYTHYILQIYANNDKNNKTFCH